MWPQSCADASEPEERGQDRCGAEHCGEQQSPNASTAPETAHSLQAAASNAAPQPHTRPLAVPAPPSCCHPLAHQKQGQLLPSVCIHVLPCREEALTQGPYIHPGIHPPPGLFPTPAPAPGPPYPHSRGSQARVLPGRSGGRTGTSPPPPPNGCKSKLLREREGRPSVTWPCHVPTQRPHGVPWHLPPAVRRPPATASPLADRPLPSHGDTYRGSTRTGGQDPIPFAPHPKTLLPPSLPCQWQYTHVHTHTPHPAPAHRYCRSFSRRSLPRLDMMSSGTLGWEEWILQGLEVGEEGSGYPGFW